MPEKGHYHNRGQEDASKGEYNPPSEGMPIITDLAGRSDRDIEDRKEYNEGWRNTKDQKK